MKILITAGGTMVKIDDVRHIANFSSGEFPSKIAEEALLAGHEVIYFHAKRAKKPFAERFAFNPAEDAEVQFKKLRTAQKLYVKCAVNITYREFQTFDEYESGLRDILSNNDIDIAFLAAAVSDYGMKPQEGKISSSQDELTLTLTKNKKVIKEVKSWSKKPVFQVGFKLLSGVEKQALIETAYISGLENKSDLTIANDLAKIREGKREVFMVTPERGVTPAAGATMAKKVVEFALRRARTTHFRTILTEDARLPNKYAKEVEALRFLCALLYRENLMPPFYNGSAMSHGSIALKVPEGFLITARGSNKAHLKDDDVVLVSRIDWDKREIQVRSLPGKKASLNAPLMQKIFESRVGVTAVIHTHSFDTKAPTTDFAETPGTLEYALAPLSLLKKKQIMNLKNHGLIALGKDLIEASQAVLKGDVIRGNCYAKFPEYYDLMYSRYFKSVPDFVKLVASNTKKAGKILDLAAGTGAVSLPLLRKGFAVHALDLHRGMLEQLKKKADQRFARRLETTVLNFNKLNFDTVFHTVCVRQAINYAKPAELSKIFKRVHQALSRGGTFVFNAPNFDPKTKEFAPVQTLSEGKDKQALVIESNTLSKRLLKHTQTALVADSDELRVVSDTNSFRLYTKDEFEKALKKAGFKKIRFLSSGLKPYRKADKTLYCVATK